MIEKVAKVFVFYSSPFVYDIRVITEQGKSWQGECGTIT